MTITLPDELAAEVQAKAKAGGFASVDAYIAYLVITDEGQDGEVDAFPGPSELTPKSREDLGRMLDEGMNSGPGVIADEAFWERLRQRIRSGANSKVGPRP